MSIDVKGLTETVRVAKAGMARARAAAETLTQSAANLAGTLEMVEGVTKELDRANAELQAEVGQLTNGPPLSSAESASPAPPFNAKGHLVRAGDAEDGHRDPSAGNPTTTQVRRGDPDDARQSPPHHM